MHIRSGHPDRRPCFQLLNLLYEGGKRLFHFRQLRFMVLKVLVKLPEFGKKVWHSKTPFWLKARQ